MNTGSSTPPTNGNTLHRVEFFRLPAPKKRDPFFGLSRGWYYKAEKRGEIKMVAVRQRGAMRGVRLVAYDSVADYIRRSAQASISPSNSTYAATQLAMPFDKV